MCKTSFWALCLPPGRGPDERGVRGIVLSLGRPCYTPFREAIYRIPSTRLPPLRPNRCRFASYAGLFIGASLYDFEKQIQRQEGHVDRRTNPESELDLQVADLYEACQDCPQWARGEDDPARQAAVHELFELVQGIADEMGERTTCVLEHCLWGKSLTEIARLMDLPDGAVKGLWQRLLIEARRRLCDPGL